MARIKTWTEEQEGILREKYHNHTCEELAPLVGHTPKSIQTKAWYLGLRKDPEWMRQKASASMFKKGHTPATKGKKWDDYMSKEKQENSRKGCFKKGQKSWNQKPIGHERKDVDGYWLVKVAQPNVFRFKHHVVWEQHHGPIPKGIVISFKDGNPDNVTIDNLMAETKKEKFMRCGCYHKIMPPEVGQLIQLKGALKRQINKIMNNGNKGRNRKTQENEK